MRSRLYKNGLHYQSQGKEKEVWEITASRSLLDIDLKGILKKIESRYKVKLPKKVVMVDYGERDDLYIRFRHVQKPLGRESDDSKVVFFYDDGRIVGLEILHLKYFV